MLKAEKRFAQKEGIIVSFCAMNFCELISTFTINNLALIIKTVPL
jgi:hypothetical protein